MPHTDRDVLLARKRNLKVAVAAGDTEWADALRALIGSEEPEPEPAAEETAESVDLDQSVVAILEAVGDDPALARAAAEAEAGRENPRATLLAALDKITD
mgnify:CR=1 FL=1